MDAARPHRGAEALVHLDFENYDPAGVVLGQDTFGDGMNHSRQVIEVFQELRRAVGGQLSARDLLAAASSMVELAAEGGKEPQFDLYEGRLPFEHLPVDVALLDGGWQVMWHEMHGGARWMRDDWDATKFERHHARMEMGVYA